MKNIFADRHHSELLRRLERLGPDAQRRWGRMSVHGMVCHLNDAFRLVLGDLTTKPRVTFIGRTLMRFIALSTPVPWPKGGVPTVPEADQEKEGTRPTDFDRDVAELRALMERFRSAGREGRLVPHPIFGQVSAGEWGRWGYRHVNHHFTQFGV